MNNKYTSLGANYYKNKNLSTKILVHKGDKTIPVSAKRMPWFNSWIVLPVRSKVHWLCHGFDIFMLEVSKNIFFINHTEVSVPLDFKIGYDLNIKYGFL